MVRGTWLIISLIVLALSGCSSANDAIGPANQGVTSLRPVNIGFA